jgi:DNA-binding NarL/FixJ family response regulator
VLTTYDTDEEISRALKAGAKAYRLKEISADDLVTCIRDVLAGKTYLAPAAAAKARRGRDARAAHAARARPRCA